MKHRQWLQGLCFALLAHTAQAQTYSMTVSAPNTGPWRADPVVIAGDSGFGYRNGWTMTHVLTGEVRQFANPNAGQLGNEISLTVDQNGDMLITPYTQSGYRHYEVMDINGRTTLSANTSIEGWGGFNGSGEGEVQICEASGWGGETAATCTLHTKNGKFTMPGPALNTSGSPTPITLSPNRAAGINSQGVLVGNYHQKVATLAPNGTLEILPFRGQGYDISDSGVIVGQNAEQGYSSSFAFIWDAQGGMRDLNTLVAPQSDFDKQHQLTAAYYISADGLTIKAWGQNTALNSYKSFTLTMVPEPSTYALMGLGLVGIVLSVRRKQAAGA